MVENVGRKSADLYVKLNSGKTINLKKLDSLVGQSTKGSVFDAYAGDDHILSKKEVENLKKQFLGAMSDGVVDQNELNKIFDSQRATNAEGQKEDFDEKTLMAAVKNILDNEEKADNLQAEKAPEEYTPPTSEKPVQTQNPKIKENNTKPQTEEPQPQANEPHETTGEKKSTTNYKIQPGDTPEKLAEKFGLEGEEANEFVQNLRQQLNGRKWFAVGENVTLNGDRQEKISQMRSEGTYTEDEAELNTRYSKTRQTRHSSGTASATPIRHAKSSRTTSTRQAQTPKYPTSVQNVIKNVKAAKGAYNLIKNDDGTYTIAISGTKFTKEHGCSNYVLKYDVNGNRISQTNNYANGRVVEGKIGANGKYTWKEKTPIKGDALKMYNTVQKNWHGQAQVVYTKNGYNIVATGTDYEKKNDIAKYVYSYDRNGKLTSKTRTYNDGKVQTSVPKNGKDNWKTTKEAQKGYFDRFTDWVSEKWDGLTSSSSSSAKKTKHTSKAKQTATAKKSASTQAQQSAAKKVAPMTFEDKCRKYLSISECGYPKGIQEKLISYREQGIGAEVEKTRTGFRMTLDEDKKSYGFEGNTLQALQRRANRVLPMNRDKKVFDFDKNGNIEKLTQDYPHKTVITPYYKGKPSTLSPMRQRTEMKEFVNYDKLDSSRVANDKVPTDLNIELPDRWKDDKDVQNYVQGLVNNKPALMKELGLTNAEYDNLASLAFGVTEQETHFGKAVYEDTKGDKHAQWRLMKKDSARAVGLISGENHSYGVAQINYWATAVGKDSNDPSVKALRQQLSKFGINSYKDYADNPEKAAIAQMIILNNKRKTAESPEWQKLISQVNARTTNPADRITTDDVTATLYNGAGGVMARMKETLNHPAGTPEGTFSIKTNNSGKLDKNGKPVKDGMSYARNVRAYRNTIKVTSSSSSQNRSAALGASSLSNYGDLGVVTFMPGAYTSRASQQSTADTVKNIQSYFNVSTTTQNSRQRANSNVDNKSLMSNVIATKSNAEIKSVLSEAKIKELLIETVNNQEVTFGGKGGLTPAEAKSIKVDDAILILKNVASLRKQIAQGNITNPAKIRELAQVTDAKFHSSYMQARQVVVNKHDVSGGSVLPGFASSDVVNERLVAHRDNVVSRNRAAFRNGHAASYDKSVNDYAAMNARGVHSGFGVVANKGVDPYFADGTMISRKERELAEVASDIASKDLATGGQCATGIKAAWQSAGVVKNRSEVVYPRNVMKKVQAGETIDSIVNSVGLSGNTAKAKYKAQLTKRLKNMAKIDSNGNLIAGKTINTRANITIRQGDTLDTILQRCGYTKDTNANAKEYNKKLIELKKQLKTDGMLDSNGKVTASKVTDTFSFSAKAVVKEGDTIESLADRFGHVNDRGRYINNLKSELQQSVALDSNGRLIAGKNIVVHNAGEAIEVAKDLHFYMDAHPEKFEQVKYVDTGKGQARELTAADIKKLPAGMTGVFIPGAGYEAQAGHAFITNGNGQGYADEVDNLGWANFVSGGSGNGKGEHGYVKFYRLSKRFRSQ